MAARKQRATTSELYALDKDYDKVVSKGKKIHRGDEAFYIYKVGECHATVSTSEYGMNKSAYDKEDSLEKYVFINRRWVLE